MSKIREESEFVYSAALSERIKELIDESECASNEQFANYVGVSTGVILKIVNHNIVPTLRPLIKIADRFDISLNYLLGFCDERNFISSLNRTTFHARFEELCKDKGLKLGSLAANVNINRAYVYEWMRKKSLPCLDNLFAIAKYFDVSVDYLLGRTDYRN